MIPETFLENLLKDYPNAPGFYDEVFDENKYIREHYRKITDHLAKIRLEDFQNMNEYARRSSFEQGITFNVYSDTSQGVERIFPFDLLPRIIPAKEWDTIERGLAQRNLALNMFLKDIYNEKKILKDKVVPKELLFSSQHYSKYMMDFVPYSQVYVHISGTDLIRHSDGEYYVLEDNLRTPSGISYVLSNRISTKRILPTLFFNSNVQPVVDYSESLLEVIKSVAPQGVDDPVCVVLTPGVYNSAYYEHALLALQMGMQLVEGRDLYVDHNFVYMKTIHGPKKVDVIYRRVDDDYIDPLAFRPDSTLGVPGLMTAYRQGNVNLVNAPGTGVADDKAVYTYVPDIIRYYLNEEPILKNVHTYRCEKDNDLNYVLEHLNELVVKPVDESGGYGIFIGNKASQQELRDFKEVIKANRRKYIAQPTMALSVHATYIEETGMFEPRHIDLRTFTLSGDRSTYVCKGGLTRVALRKGNLIVNSSQGGGSKDTWVLQDE
ncbi:circularly permuted type 2 ATP-grasp protein [Cesiribacter sp. SM1]|uniref:circularly permuted type 2 ATP-grasp protein n=1 Tax=Cesiribacter sp. SM1 TaxID=2861196 RepID=UPI001CD3FE3E|nr:circularly permuted type 2 ATP-grasp protein [Cesiribacter sp. SM1]